MKRTGPDSFNSWMISIFCCFINMMLFGMARLSGVLFVASISRFNVSRAKASFPYTFLTFVRCVSGPLVGFLGHRYGVRMITTIGCLLGAIGAGACFFAESIDSVTVTWGVILGLGFGLGNILLPVAINQHFDKQRATASGISFSGGCFGSFVLPPIVDILLNTYGLSGTFLFLSGFILNCVPAALLLRKPNLHKKTRLSECCPNKKQNASDWNTKKYSLENIDKASKVALKDKTGVNIRSKDEQESHDKYDSKEMSNTKDNRLPPQSFLSNTSFEVRSSYHLNVENKLVNSTCKSRNDSNTAETYSLPSSYTDRYTDCGTDLFQLNIRSSSVKYVKPVFLANKTGTSPENNLSHTREHIFPKNDAYLNFGYQVDKDEDNVNQKLDVHGKVISSQDNSINESSQSKTIVEMSKHYSNQTNNKVSNFTSKNSENPYNTSVDFRKHVDELDIYSFEKTKKIIVSPMKNIPRAEGKSWLGSFSVIIDPMFILIAITNSIYNFTFVVLVTVIVDFTRDLNIGLSNEKYVLMALSVGDCVGRLGLGWITDRGYMSTTAFAALCFACQGITTAALTWSNGFPLLIILTILYGLEEGGIIIIIPIIIAQYVDLDKQTVAISSSHFLTGPLCLVIAPMIGYFRDGVGSYNYIFYVVALLSAACSLSLLLSPYVAKCKARSSHQTK